MTIRNLMRGIMTLLLIGGLSACQTTTTTAEKSDYQTAANTPPWDLPKPEGMTSTHQDNMMAARVVQKRLPDGGFSYYDPVKAPWDKNDGINRTIPMSNMTIAGMTSLITGKYHIGKFIGQDLWAVRYYAPDGVTHFCGYENGEYRESTANRYVVRSSFGIAGMIHSEKGPQARKTMKGWPMVADSNRGLLFSYYWTKRKWVAQPGWIQAEYAAAFAEHCPNLPRVTKLNNNQLGDTFSDLMREATPVRGFQTAFKNDPEDPFTASMYYWSYPSQ